MVDLAKRYRPVTYFAWYHMINRHAAVLAANYTRNVGSPAMLDRCRYRVLGSVHIVLAR